MRMMDITNYVERLLTNAARSTSLWLMKTYYKGINEAERLEARNVAALRIRELRIDFDFELADLWIEFLNWTTTYEDK